VSVNVNEIDCGRATRGLAGRRKKRKHSLPV
jgi:hypothetical protein